MHVTCSWCNAGITPLTSGEEPWQAHFLVEAVLGVHSGVLQSVACKITGVLVTYELNLNPYKMHLHAASDTRRSEVSLQSKATRSVDHVFH